MIERRKHRSRYRGIALNLFLEAVAKRNEVAAVAVGDEDGLLVGGSAPTDEVEEMAAMAASRAKPGSKHQVMDARGMTMVVRWIPLERETLFVCAKGLPDRGAKALDEAASGIQRILLSA
jgi:hypothetical protein